MADDFDVDALLEEPYTKKEMMDCHQSLSDDNDGLYENGKSEDVKNNSRDEKSRERSSGSDRHRDRRHSRDKSRRSRSRDKKRHRSRSSSRDRRRRSRSYSRDRRRRSRSRSRDRRRRSRDRGHRRSSSRDRRRRSRSPFSHGRRSFVSGIRGGNKSPSPRQEKSPGPMLTQEERDSRTIFIMQLSQRVRAKDVEDFFSAVGPIKDTKLIICNKTRRFKGIAYVEFKNMESVHLALGLSGQKILGVPIIVQPSQAEKNRAASYGSEASVYHERGPMRLYVGSLHFNITEEMLRGIFEPFGRIQNIQLITDSETGRSKGYGFISFCEAEDAKKALEQMNGFELAGRCIKVGPVNDRSSEAQYASGGGVASIESDGLYHNNMSASGRLQLMAKLAEGAGMILPEAATQALQVMTTANSTITPQQTLVTDQPQITSPPIATQCFMLSNMFDPEKEEAGTPWDIEVKDDVIDECNKYGGVLHIYVDKASPQGNVYVKCPSIQTAVATINALHGRWFAGKLITAAYVPIVNYHNLFRDAVHTSTLLTTTRR